MAEALEVEGPASREEELFGLIDACAFFAPGDAAVVESLKPGGDGVVAEEDLVDSEGGRERRWIGGGTKGEKVGLSESPIVRDMSARCIILMTSREVTVKLSWKGTVRKGRRTVSAGSQE